MGEKAKIADLPRRIWACPITAMWIYRVGYGLANSPEREDKSLSCRNHPRARNKKWLKVLSNSPNDLSNWLKGLSNSCLGWLTHSLTSTRPYYVFGVGIDTNRGLRLEIFYFRLEMFDFRLEISDLRGIMSIISLRKWRYPHGIDEYSIDGIQNNPISNL